MVQKQRADEIEKLNELISDIEIAMLTTQEADGTLRSRPMGTQQVEFDGDLWFFTRIDAAKVHEVQQDRHVNVSYADEDNQRYVSVSGTAQVMRDQAKIDELWNPIAKVWFPDGKDDPSLALMKVHVTQAEYWDAAANRMVQLAHFAKALVTGNGAEDMGENRKIRM
ncbi:MAG: pyridoxamine 5'-phosphate oxidase family protein [Caldilineaceae bacterium]